MLTVLNLTGLFFEVYWGCLRKPSTLQVDLGGFQQSGLTIFQVHQFLSINKHNLAKIEHNILLPPMIQI